MGKVFGEIPYIVKKRIIVMEKQIKVIARYHYKHEYFVEVTHEDSVIAKRDYWLCKRGSARKMYMFSSAFKSAKDEEHQIMTEIQDAIREYENPMVGVKYA